MSKKDKHSANEARINTTHIQYIKLSVLSPLGKMPGSMNVAIQKLAKTNRKTTPL